MSRLQCNSTGEQRIGDINFYRINLSDVMVNVDSYYLLQD